MAIPLPSCVSLVVGLLVGFLSAALVLSHSTVVPVEPLTTAEGTGKPRVRPACASTWRFGEIAVSRAKPLLEKGKSALDALEEGGRGEMERECQSLTRIHCNSWFVFCSISLTPCSPFSAGITAVELNTQDQYFVGLGGLPNSEGAMEFDAAVMDGATVMYGAVMAVRGIVRAFSAARLVMERSKHSVIVGEGATKFALSEGVKGDETLTPLAQEQYEDWNRSKDTEDRNAGAATPGEREESHDTVGMICLDERGNMAAGTSTSGWKFKHPGRVGDAPVVGSGLYCDNAVGAAVATGDGEEILRTCLSFLVVEYMRAGDPPALACQKGIKRLRAVVERSSAGKSGTAKPQMHNKLTVAVMAMSPSGEIGAASTLGPQNEHRGRPAFPFALWREGESVRVVEEGDL